jgi:hypothetical protein
VPFLFLASAFTVVFGFFPAIGNNDYFPTDADFTDAFNLTSWIVNDTTRDEILDYLLLCPEQDMCLGEKFKRFYNFTLHPACSTCECHDSCVRRATCCPSKFYRQTPAPDFIEYPPTFDDIQGPPVHCLEPLWDMASDIKSSQAYWMINTCPDDTFCILPPSRNITKSTPVTSLITRESYINMECASCNNEELFNLVLWEKKKLCISRFALLLGEDLETVFNTVFQPLPVCNVGFYPPASVENVVKTCLGNTIDVNCEDRTHNRVKGYLTKACRKYFLPYRAYNEVYKNIYCALCDKGAKYLYVQNEIYGGQINFNPVLPSFTALMDFKMGEKQPIANKMKCTANKIFDERLVSCVISLSIFFYSCMFSFFPKIHF